MITANLVNNGGEHWAEYQNHDGSLTVSVKIDEADFQEFAELEATDEGIVTRDRDYDDLMCSYETWFDTSQDLREEYAKTLPHHHAAVLLAAVVNSENK